LHELRNKMSIVSLASSNLLLDCDELSSDRHRLSPATLVANTKRRAERIGDASGDLGDLLDEYLGLTRLAKVERVDINEVLASTARQIALVAKEQDVTITTRFGPNLPSVMAVMAQLAQVFLNVALNALQQMRILRERYEKIPAHKRGALRCHLRISSTVDPNDKDVPLKIRFADEGPGIHRKHWNWIFELGTSTRADGTGLGLYICRTLLAAMGGRISVERSHMFVGTTFLIELPAAPGREGVHG
jgi:signal transduction histidine kinase